MIARMLTIATALDWERDIAEAVALTETSIYADLAREQFVADAMAEIETLTGGEVA